MSFRGLFTRFNPGVNRAGEGEGGNGPGEGQAQEPMERVENGINVLFELFTRLSADVGNISAHLGLPRTTPAAAAAATAAAAGAGAPPAPPHAPPAPRPEGTGANQRRGGHREVVSVQEAAEIRAFLARYWVGSDEGNPLSPSDEELDAFRQAGSTVVPLQTLKDMTFEENYKSDWNKVLVSQLTREHIYPLLNAKCPRPAPQLPRTWDTFDRGELAYRRKLQERIRKAILHIWKKETLRHDAAAHRARNANAMQMQSRTRLYNARLSVAQSLPYMRVNGVRLVKLLGTNGMSSEEDDPHDDSTALIRSLDWRAPQCVPFLRHLDTVHTARRAFGRRGILAHFDESDAEEDMEVDEGAVPDGRRFKRTRRRRVPAAPIASHRNAKPNPEMPHNLYNWAVMQERLGVTEYDRDTYIRPSAPDPTLFDINFPRRNNAAPPPA